MSQPTNRPPKGFAGPRPYNSESWAKLSLSDCRSLRRVVTSANYVSPFGVTRLGIRSSAEQNKDFRNSLRPLFCAPVLSPDTHQLSLLPVAAGARVTPRHGARCCIITYGSLPREQRRRFPPTIPPSMHPCASRYETLVSWRGINSPQPHKGTAPASSPRMGSKHPGGGRTSPRRPSGHFSNAAPYGSVARPVRPS